MMRMYNRNIHHSFSRGTLLRIFLIFLFIVGLVISVYTNNQTNDLKDHVWAMNNQSTQSLEKTIILQFFGYELFDNSLNNRIKDDFIPYFEAYQNSGGRVEDIDLNAVRNKTGEMPDMIDLYIINSSDVIIATTNNKELLLNFKTSAPLFANYLDEIRNKSGFFPDQVTMEIQSAEWRKWAYMPTPDHKYILEIGIKETTFGTERKIHMNLSEISRDIYHSNRFVKSISIWDFLGNQVGSSNGIKETPDQRVHEMFHTGQSRFRDVTDGIPVREIFLIKSNNSLYGYDSSLISQIDINYPLIQQEIMGIYMRMAGLFLLVAIISGILLFLTINRISRPIQEIISDITLISQGNLDHPIRETGIAELSTLSIAISTMKESILRGQSDNLHLEQEKASALLQIQQNLAYFAILNDEIRNPLMIILTYADMLNDVTVKNQINDQVLRIDEAVNQLDQRWVESEKVLNAIRKHYKINLAQTPDPDNPENRISMDQNPAIDSVSFSEEANWYKEGLF